MNLDIAQIRINDDDGFLWLIDIDSLTPDAKLKILTKGSQICRRPVTVKKRVPNLNAYIRLI